ncbi:hypothetical protein F5144DRAFT_543112 [Chaetomium tenue]|uniref:Uncharacterized protein n=1 Tax=Chaetomium tenue TaxID=1854479 RepID=A0ACB7PS08_9PEZI|nr:hypothetical protein F5144DRAFT_543112 [Chaetomium globosum]
MRASFSALRLLQLLFLSPGFRHSGPQSKVEKTGYVRVSRTRLHHGRRDRPFVQRRGGRRAPMSSLPVVPTQENLLPKRERRRKPSRPFQHNPSLRRKGGFPGKGSTWRSEGKGASSTRRILILGQAPSHYLKGTSLVPACVLQPSKFFAAFLNLTGAMAP